ncbi:hypothetical protein V8F20_005629 [Naviculisporaceae sp. PSN 640]
MEYLPTSETQDLFFISNQTSNLLTSSPKITMTYSILITNTRKPGTTPEEFRNGCEALIPFIKEMAGEHFPLSHTRHYIQRTESPRGEGNSELNPTTPAIVIMGKQADADWDSISELVFADELAFKAYIDTLMEPNNWARLQERESKVVDTEKSKIVVVGEALVTKKN